MNAPWIAPWTDVPAVDMAAAYAGEVSRWRDVLGWDTTGLWADVERGRVARRVAGFAVTAPDDTLLGWTFFVRHRADVQIGGIWSASEAATATLLEAVAASRDAESASRLVLFGFTNAVGLRTVLRRQGFAAGEYRYLSRRCEPARLAGAGAGRPWRPGDLPDAAALVHAAYPEPDPLRPFGGDGGGGEWLDYLTQIITTTGCGLFDPALSRVAPRRGGGLDGLALVTRIAERAAHLAQLAVHPEAQGRGLGRTLVEAAVAAASAHGIRRLTLLVSETNEPARRLYARLGFTQAAAFVSASKALDVPARIDAGALPFSRVDPAGLPGTMPG